MEVLKFLETRTLADLTEEYGIKVREYPDRYVINYDQIESSSHRFKGIVRECRSLILDRKFNVMSRSFDRFFNYGEDPETELFPIRQAQVFEKIDGSLINAYFDGSKWCMSTRSMAFSEGETSNPSLSFSQIITKAIGSKEDESRFFKKLDKRFTYIFELVSPLTRVVKHYGERPALYLLSIRNKNSGRYIPQAQCDIIADGLKVRRPKRYSFNSVQDIQDSMKDLPAMDEGYVAIYENDGRNPWFIKIKNPAYLAIANIRMNGVLSPKRIAILVMGHDEDEYLQYFPEDKSYFDPYIRARHNLDNKIKSKMALFGDIEEQKEFALKVKDLCYSSVLFQMRKGNSYDKILSRLSDDAKLRLLDCVME